MADEKSKVTLGIEYALMVTEREFRRRNGGGPKKPRKTVLQGGGQAAPVPAEAQKEDA